MRVCAWPGCRKGDLRDRPRSRSKADFDSHALALSPKTAETRYDRCGPITSFLSGRDDSMAGISGTPKATLPEDLFPVTMDNVHAAFDWVFAPWIKEMGLTGIEVREG